ncbi:MAG TPA: hypothetical protein VN785_00635 [Candidatus Angelobacter sp.]|nr:hypothetical protein [Candidatus Angelobacter sp.]
MLALLEREFDDTNDDASDHPLAVRYRKPFPGFLPQDPSNL